MDTEAINQIIKNINEDYDLSDPDDVTQLVIDILSTFDKNEYEEALIYIKNLGG